MRAVLLLLAFSGLVATIAPTTGADAAEVAGYRVIAEEANEAKRIVSVRLDKRLSEPELARIAEVVRGRHAQPVPRTLIQFYLSSARPGGVAWATATLAPDLRLIVSGLSAEEEALLVIEAQRETRDVVGAWLTEPPASPGSLLIVRDKGRLTAEWRLRGGHRTVDEVSESRWNGGHRYDIRGGDGQHYVVTRAGTLELRDKSSLIAVADPLRPQATAPQIVHSNSPTSASTSKDAGRAAAAAAVVVAGKSAASALDAGVQQSEARTEKPLMVPAPSSATLSSAAVPPPAPVLPQAVVPAAPQAPNALVAEGEPTKAVAADAQAAAQNGPNAPAKQAASKAHAGKPHAAKQVIARPQRSKPGSDQSVAALMAAKLGQ